MILLCGYGGDGRRVNEINVKKQIINICKNKKVAIITNAKPKDNIETDIEVGRFLKEHEIKNQLFDLDAEDVSWQNFDVIYFGGGSPLKLMGEIKRNHYQNFDWSSKDIIGQSAGGMILFENFVDEITMGQNSNPNINDFQLFEGLGVVKGKKVFTPHFNTLPNSNYGKTYLKYLHKNKIETIVIEDKQFLLI